jgi:hypothetical protein
VREMPTKVSWTSVRSRGEDAMVTEAGDSWLSALWSADLGVEGVGPM